MNFFKKIKKNLISTKIKEDLNIEKNFEISFNRLKHLVKSEQSEHVVFEIKTILKNKNINPFIEKFWLIQECFNNEMFYILDLLLVHHQLNDKYTHKLLKYSSANNNIYILQKLLENKNIDISFHNNYLIRNSVTLRHLEFTALLLKDPRIDPIKNNNSLIIETKYNDKAITELLWSDSRIKNTLKLHDLKLYNKLIKNKSIKNKNIISI
jgi:hypothetical protein